MGSGLEKSTAMLPLCPCADSRLNAGYVTDPDPHRVFEPAQESLFLYPLHCDVTHAVLRTQTREVHAS